MAFNTAEKTSSKLESSESDGSKLESFKSDNSELLDSIESGCELGAGLKNEWESEFGASRGSDGIGCRVDCEIDEQQPQDGKRQPPKGKIVVPELG